MVTSRSDRTSTDGGTVGSFLDYLRPSWMEDAACRGSDLDFTDEAPANVSSCLQVCGRCSQMLACRAFAVEDKTLVGVWGGTTTAARRSMRTNRAKR